MHNVGMMNPQKATHETLFQVKKHTPHMNTVTVETKVGKIFALYVLACEKYADLELDNAIKIEEQTAKGAAARAAFDEKKLEFAGFDGALKKMAEEYNAKGRAL